ncbi:hypothetical protein EXIGLDRAFT_779783 [Exidia glandulosa HHB12029]|uniref:Uncharacterized protein n=1 Tax=Exidia glandulosa HHB12029 TaxID=1314781 RepID=A0A165ZC43_EXIGL|nr:hypothetical protein EXIGLDRAFT_779783 [Exidia glandulosa HHB12029]
MTSLHLKTYTDTDMVLGKYNPEHTAHPTGGGNLTLFHEITRILHSVSASILQTAVWKDAAAAFSPYGPPRHDYNAGWGPSGDQLPGLGPGWYAVRPENPQDWGLVPDISCCYDPLLNYLPLRTSNLENDDLYGSGWLSTEVDLGRWQDPAWDKLELVLDVNPPPSLPLLIHNLSFARIMTTDERLAAWETYIDFCQIVGACASRCDMLNLPTVTCNRLRPCVRCRLSGSAAPEIRALYEPAAQCDLDYAMQKWCEKLLQRDAVITFRRSFANQEPHSTLVLSWLNGLRTLQGDGSPVECYSKPNLSANDLNDEEQLHREHAVLEEELEQTLKLKQDVNKEQALALETRGTTETDESG